MGVVRGVRGVVGGGLRMRDVPGGVRAWGVRACVCAKGEARREARGEPPHAWRGAEAEGVQTAAANEARVEVWARPGETSGL